MLYLLFSVHVRHLTSTNTRATNEIRFVYCKRGTKFHYIQYLLNGQELLTGDGMLELQYRLKATFKSRSTDSKTNIVQDDWRSFRENRVYPRKKGYWPMPWRSWPFWTRCGVGQIIFTLLVNEGLRRRPSLSEILPSLSVVCQTTQGWKLISGIPVTGLFERFLWSEDVWLYQVQQFNPITYNQKHPIIKDLLWTM